MTIKFNKLLTCCFSLVWLKFSLKLLNSENVSFLKLSFLHLPTYYRKKKCGMGKNCNITIKIIFKNVFRYDLFKMETFFYNLIK